MADPESDEDALTWAGDEQEVARPVTAPAASPAPGQSGAPTLVGLGILGGIAVLETVGWLRSVFSVTLESTVQAAAGPLGTVAFALNVLGRAAAVAAPLLWFLLAAGRIRNPTRRWVWLALGALLLLPWPALLGLL